MGTMLQVVGTQCFLTVSQYISNTVNVYSVAYHLRMDLHCGDVTLKGAPENGPN